MNMSNVGGSSMRPGSEQYELALTRMAVAQICYSVGFRRSNDLVLNAVTDITVRLLSNIAKVATFYCNLSGRTQCNVFDVVRALEDVVGSSLGFLGAWSSEHCLLRSGLVEELVRFVESSEVVPYFVGVPRLPVARNWKSVPSFENVNEVPPGKHIPCWLPVLPDPQTYLCPLVGNVGTVETREEKVGQVRQGRKAEEALLNSQPRLSSKGFSARDWMSYWDGGNENVKLINLGGSGERFLDVSLGHWEKGSSVVCFPEKPRLGFSILEVFEPAIKAVKEGGIALDDLEIEKESLLHGRPFSNFKFKPVKKMFGVSFDSTMSRQGGRRTGQLLGCDDRMDNKKRRVEYILRQCVENPQEFIQC